MRMRVLAIVAPIMISCLLTTGFMAQAIEPIKVDADDAAKVENLLNSSIEWQGDTVFESYVSGLTARKSVMGWYAEPNLAIHNIEWEEQKNHPCLIKIFGRNLNDPGQDYQRPLTKDECGPGDSADKKVAMFEGDSPLADFWKGNLYLRGIQTCPTKNSRNAGRIKGIKIYAATIDRTAKRVDFLRLGHNPDPVKEGMPETGISKHKQCDTENWNRLVECKDGWLASGLNVHIRNNEEIVGIGLRCRQVKFPVVSKKRIEGP